MIPLMKVHVPPNIANVIGKVWDSGFVTEGEYSDRFEKMLGEYIGNENTCLTNSCTSSLTLASHMCGIKPGDEVITTAMTCMATNEPFYAMGAKLVFADIEKDTGNIDPIDIEKKITEKTKAIVIVHWSGSPCRLREITSIANKHNIPVVEDAAHALNSKYDGKKIGNHGDFVCFSFQAVKHLTTADGGAICCKTKEDAERIRKLRWFGLDRSLKCASRWDQDIKESGYKFHMNNMNAAIGIEQLKYIDDLIGKHRNNGILYDKEINNPKIQKIKKQPDGVEAESSCWIYSVLVENKDDFREYMLGKGIGVDVAHVRNDKYSCFQDFRETLPGLDYFSDRMMNIPVGWWISQEEKEHIIESVNNY